MPAGAALAPLTVRLWHKRVRGSDRWIEARGLRFELRGKRAVLAGHTSTNCDVEVEVDARQLLDLMRALVAKEEGR